MKFCVLTGQYPNSASPYRHGFVHTRNLWYRHFGHEVLVLVPAKQRTEYQYDGINVIEAPVQELMREMSHESIDTYCIHLLLHRMDKEVDAGLLYDWLLQSKSSVLFFIHGVETQKIWQSRRGDIKWYRPFTVARMLYRDFYLIKRMQKTLAEFLSQPSCQFIAPSKWMFEESFNTTGVNVGDSGTVIPNGINTELFEFTERWQDRHKVLAIRPLTTQAKYAVDLFIDSAANANQEIHFHLYGDGSNEEVERINSMITRANADNFTLHRTFIKNTEIPALHQRYGVYGAVTRMDAQGVSMCEAMASGLPTVSFDITAIGEFITSGENGFLANPYDLQEYTGYIQELAEDRQLFERIAAAGRASMEAIDVRNTCNMEIDLAQSL